MHLGACTSYVYLSVYYSPNSRICVAHAMRYMMGGFALFLCYASKFRFFRVVNFLRGSLRVDELFYLKHYEHCKCISRMEVRFYA